MNPFYEICHCPNDFQGWHIKRVVARFPDGSHQPYRQFTCKACGNKDRWFDLYGTPEYNTMRKNIVIERHKMRLRAIRASNGLCP